MGRIVRRSHRAAAGSTVHAVKVRRRCKEGNAMRTNLCRRWLTIVAVSAIGLIATAVMPRATEPSMDDEQEVGQEAFNELKAKGEIVASSPLYDQLMPIANAVVKTAQPHYNHPFKFYLVHEPQPNAFATPGGNVYVTDSLMYFVKNTEQLSGTICHEVSHTIHHDS